MKMKLYGVLLMGLFSCQALSATHQIHQWITGAGSGGWRTQFHMTNTCLTNDVNVTYQFWQHNGTYLSNTSFGGFTTDGQGRFSLTISPRETIEINMAPFGTFTTGSATITSSYGSGVESDQCLVAGYSSFAFSGGGIINRSYLLNNGFKF